MYIRNGPENAILLFKFKLGDTAASTTHKLSPAFELSVVTIRLCSDLECFIEESLTSQMLLAKVEILRLMTRY